MKLDSKYFDRIRKRPRQSVPNSDKVCPKCQWDGCNRSGEHRAPVGRNAEGQFFVFCFEHVKKYNKGYNYFSGLSDNEIGRYQKEAITGHRPTWVLGTNSAIRSAQPSSEGKNDYFQLEESDSFSFIKKNSHGYNIASDKMVRYVKPLEANAFEMLGLLADSSPEEITSRYKDLVKKHHPDSNGGDRGSEGRFRAVIQAYRLLKQSGFC
ncbi:hypothetical protein B488_11300 [Liberibacter crescens BT-1]|uniref:J domain-containing protein n=1 Tax=Liberibacter crescens (strain BT-1) TaxID=1215343 RepID=L0EVY6_LIBCB|nr:J domain-containing protein [Liberibacter crescens]AGA65122.1 hypothetical protein B488_11300 [Liberibacter crescens BT-1]AMC13094.1 molecular chaperone DnaJ [Liberibacter crescens]